MIDVFPVSAFQVISNEGKVLDFRSKLTGNYGPDGLALDQTALRESAAAYQLAVDVLNMEQQRIATPFILGLVGSFARGLPRPGIFDPRYLTYDEVENIINGRSRIRRSGFPSDLDFVTNRLLSEPDNRSLEIIARRIFRTTGVFTDYFPINETDNTTFVPFVHLIDRGLEALVNKVQVKEKKF